MAQDDLELKKERAGWPTMKGQIDEVEGDYTESVITSPGKALELVWELTTRSFYLKDREALERPFQRHTTRVIRGQS
jgi:hypothetical protein